MNKGGCIGFANGIARHFRPVVCRGSGNIFNGSGINPGADRERSASVHPVRLLKQPVDFLLGFRFRRAGGKVIRGHMAAVLLSENGCQLLRKGFQQSVALGKAVPVIEVFHPVQIKIQKAALFSFAEHSGLPRLVKFEEPCQIRQSGQTVVMSCVENAFLVQCLVQCPVQFGSGFFFAFDVNTFVHVPNVGDPLAGLRMKVSTPRMDHAVIGIRTGAHSVDDVQVFLSVIETQQRARNAFLVRHVDVFDRLMIQNIHGARPVGKAEEPAKPVGNCQGLHFMVGKPVNRHRLRQVLRCFPRSGGILVFLSCSFLSAVVPDIVIIPRFVLKHFLIGPSDHRLRIIPVLAHRITVGNTVSGCFHAFPDPFEHSLESLFIPPEIQNHEFVSADPVTPCIRVRSRVNAFTDLFQRRIPCGMTLRVIDGFQIVHIHGSGGADAFSERLAVIIQGLPVQKQCQRIPPQIIRAEKHIEKDAADHDSFVQPDAAVSGVQQCGSQAENRAGNQNHALGLFPAVRVAPEGHPQDQNQIKDGNNKRHIAQRAAVE